MEEFKRKSSRYLLSVLVVYALLVAPHEGEFWPFSIYPMFSKAGKLWTRALVREVSSTPDSLKWQITDLNHLQGSAVTLEDYGIDQIDYANFVSKTIVWDKERKLALQKMFGEGNIGDHKFMIMKVSGWLERKDSVVTCAAPLFLVTKDSVYSNPQLDLNPKGTGGDD